MHTITTPLTKFLGIQTPIVLAPMAFGTGVSMPSTVSREGGFGFMPAGFDSSDTIRQNLRTIRKTLSIKEGTPVPVGVGFIGWILDMTEAPESDDHRLLATLAEKPAAVWFAFGKDLGKYIAQVHQFNQSRTDGHKTAIFIIVNSVEYAMKAVNEWGVDVLVVQGNEAGGHGGSESPPLFLLLPEVLSAFSDNAKKPYIIAAGGISTGSQIAALLTLGADGVAVGTKFLFTEESIYSQAQKDELVKAGWGSTTRGLMFDEVGRTNGWPPKHNGRAIVNSIVDDLNEGLNLDERMKRFDESAANGKSDRLVIWAGVGVALTKEIQSIKDVFLQLHDEAVATLRAKSTLLASE
ncbi:hypothetical protein ONZ45_g16803 [Pleurotus djamor]|nr:hypothetical protein ONZ45_g16803 [Pleurotus djamor]